MKGWDPVTSKGSLIGKTFINMHNHFAWTGGKANSTVKWIIMVTVSKPLAKETPPTTYIYCVFQQQKNMDNQQSISIHIYMLKF